MNSIPRSTHIEPGRPELPDLGLDSVRGPWRAVAHDESSFTPRELSTITEILDAVAPTISVVRGLEMPAPSHPDTLIRWTDQDLLTADEDVVRCWVRARYVAEALNAWHASLLDGRSTSAAAEGGDE